MRWHVSAVLAIAVGFSSAGLAWGQGQPAAQKPVAVVNGEAIPRAEFDVLWSRVPPAPTPMTEERKKAMQMEIVGWMMDEILFKQFLKKAAAAADQRQVDQRWAELEKGLKAKGRTIADFCVENAITEAHLRADIAAAVQWNTYVNQVVKESEMKRFYDENRALFDGTNIRASQIFLNAPRAADTKTHKEALQKMQAIRQQLKEGMDFAAAAKKYSQDGSAANGGDLGYFPPTKVDQDPFMRTAYAMKPGTVSDIVQTDYGYHLIKLVDRKDGKPTTYEQEKENVRLLVADDLRTRIIMDQRKGAKIEVNLPQ